MMSKKRTLHCNRLSFALLIELRTSSALHRASMFLLPFVNLSSLQFLFLNISDSRCSYKKEFLYKKEIFDA